LSVGPRKDFFLLKCDFKKKKFMPTFSSSAAPSSEHISEVMISKENGFRGTSLVTHSFLGTWLLYDLDKLWASFAFVSVLLVW
jgi:hypothetical protein